MEFFCKNSQKLESVHYLCKILQYSEYTSKLVDWYASIMLLNVGWYLWNFSKHVSRTFTFYLAVPRALFAHLRPALLFGRGIFRTTSSISDGVFLRAQFSYAKNTPSSMLEGILIVEQRNWFGCCYWIYFFSTLFQRRTNLS